MLKKIITAAAGAALVVGLAVVPAGAASASSQESGIRDCGSSRYVAVNSTSSGRINHSVEGFVIGTWNNGAVQTYRIASSGKHAGYWRAYLTGVGGAISSAGTTCLT